MVVNEYVLEYDGIDESAEARVCSKTAENLLFILDYMNDDKNPVKVIDFGKCPVRTEDISVSKIISFNTDRELKDIWVENNNGKRLHWFDLTMDDRRKLYKFAYEYYCSMKIIKNSVYGTKSISK